MNRNIFYFFYFLCGCVMSIMLASCSEDDTRIGVTNITLSTTSSTLTVGETLTLSATLTPAEADDQSITWSSSDATVATVSTEGVVTAVANGTSTITATTTDGAFTATCVVTVVTPVTGLTLDKTTVAVVVNSTYTLTATLAPATASTQTVTWASSDTEVATISTDGVITGVATGAATITATTTDGSFTATCEVYVAENTYTFNGTTVDIVETALYYSSTYNLYSLMLYPQAVEDGAYADAAAYVMCGVNGEKLNTTITFSTTASDYGGDTPDWGLGIGEDNMFYYLWSNTNSEDIPDSGYITTRTSDDGDVIQVIFSVTYTAADNTKTTLSGSYAGGLDYQESE